MHCHRNSCHRNSALGVAVIRLQALAKVGIAAGDRRRGGIADVRCTVVPRHAQLLARKTIEQLTRRRTTGQAVTAFIAADDLTVCIERIADGFGDTVVDIGAGQLADAVEAIGRHEVVVEVAQRERARGAVVIAIAIMLVIGDARLHRIIPPDIVEPRHGIVNGVGIVVLKRLPMLPHHLTQRVCAARGRGQCAIGVIIIARGGELSGIM